MASPFPSLSLSCKAVVIGTGISGLFTALKLAESGVKTILLTKSYLQESNSRYAQGGIAAVLPGNPSDSLELHVQDTLIAGAGLCDEQAVRSILSEGWESIEDLLLHGVPFDRTSDGEQGLALGREAAHSVPRILHVGGDATGHGVEMALIEAVQKNPNITVMEYAPVTELTTEDGVCTGCRAISLETGQTYDIRSEHIVLATGGIGRLYTHTTNPAVATGDGLALAYRAGADIRDMEFIQFHPTAFYSDGQVRFLVSEALRGEGGILRNLSGEAFAAKYHPQAELAPRDIVTRAIYQEMQMAETPHVWLDMTALPAKLLEARFPTILKHALSLGVDIRTDWIPVAPAAHYLMGGIATDTYGISSLPNLYAVGEVARTGLHGANRLASNSLLECVVLARRVARTIASCPDLNGQSPETEEDPILFIAPPYRQENNPEVLQRRQEACKLMWNQVGILRDASGLHLALSQLDCWLAEAIQKDWSHCLPDGQTFFNQLMVSKLVTEAALGRTSSKGAHLRTDDLKTAEKLTV